MALQFNVDLRLLNGLLSVSSVFWPLSPIRNSAFINICTSVHNSTICVLVYIPSCYLHLIKPCPLPRSIPIRLTVSGQQFSFSNSHLVYGDRLSACRPTPNLAD
jgi:hypothetical protein